MVSLNQLTRLASQKVNIQGVTRRVAAVVSALLVIVVGLVLAPLAGASLPSGTITLATGNSTEPRRVSPIANTSVGMLFFSWQNGGAHFVVSSAGTATSVPIGQTRYSSGCGDVVAGDTAGIVEWRNVVTNTSGTRELSTGRTLAGPAPDGWVERDSAGNLHHVVAATGASNTIGTIAEPGKADCDATRLAYGSNTRGGTSSIFLTTFASGGPQTLVSETPPAGFSVQFNVLAIRGTTVAYARQVTDPTGHISREVRRQDLGGQPSTLLSTNTGYSSAAALTATGTFIISRTDEERLYYAPLGGPGLAVPGWSSTFEGNSQLSTTPAGVRMGVPGADTGGLYAVTPAGVTSLWTPPIRPMTANSLALSAGRASWTDDREATGSVWTRSVTGTATLTAGPESLLSNHVSSGDVAASGRRTAWSHDVTRVLTIATAGAPTTTLAHTGGPRMLRGHRVLLQTDSTTAVASIHDLVTSTTTDVPNAFAVWGDTAYLFDPAAMTISARSLTTASQAVVVTSQQLMAAAVAQGFDPATSYISYPALQGDVLAWSVYRSHQNGQDCLMAWRNLKTGTSGASQFTEAFPSGVSVYGRYVAHTAQAMDRVTSVYDATTGTIVFDSGTDPDAAMPLAAIGPQGLAWVSTSGELKVTPVPDQRLVPRHEGNPFAPKTYNTGAGTWTGEWVFTEPLTSCAVHVKNPSGTTIRTLTCDTPSAAMGEVVATWDGKDSTGTLVPSASYTWTVAASDKDGPAVDTDGEATSITGTITVTNAGLTNPAAFVTSAYQDFLGRTPTASELNTAVTNLGNGTWSRERLLGTLANSPEWVRVIVTKMYRDTLGRDPDPSGLSTWVDWIRTGRFTVAEAAALFYSSQEFYQGLGGNTDPTWVTQLYQKLLGRNPDAGGLNGWIDFTRTQGRAWVASQFYQSYESRLTRVNNLYQALLGRGPDPTGWPFWANVILTSGDIQLAASLAASAEYYLRADNRY